MGQVRGDRGAPIRRVSATVLTEPWRGCSEANKPMEAAALISDGQLCRLAEDDCWGQGTAIHGWVEGRFMERKT